MVTVTTKYKGYKYEYSVDREKTITDHRGLVGTISNKGFFDMRTLKDFRLESIGQVINWLFANLDEVTSVVPGDTLDRYFDRVDVVGRTPANLRSEMYDVSEAPLTIVRDGGSSSLLLGNTEEGTPVCRVTTFGFCRYIEAEQITESSPTTPSHPQDWYRKLNYTFKMDPDEFNFFRTTKRCSTSSSMYGMELEISTKLTPFELQQIVTEVEPKQEPFFIFKDDSSVSGCYANKLELVTVPATARYLKENWAKFFKKIDVLVAAKGEQVSDYFDTSVNLSNGIHVHVSKNRFSNALHERKFVSAWNQWDRPNKELLQTMSGRHTMYSDNQYCPIDRAYEGRTLARRLKGLRSESRSVCHSSGRETVEVRLFQGIFDLKHLLSCLESVDAMFTFVERIGFSTFGRSFSGFFTDFVIKSGNSYRNLKEKLSCA